MYKPGKRQLHSLSIVEFCGFQCSRLCLGSTVFCRCPSDPTLLNFPATFFHFHSGGFLYGKKGALSGTSGATELNFVVAVWHKAFFLTRICSKF